ncbi:MAG: sugar ABC transporter permease [Euzebyales bacterium]|nr:sugar ABC transporter permease [Euzebyales bacterium]
MLKVANGLIAIVGGVGGVMLLFYILNMVVERLPGEWEGRLKPYVFIGPAIFVVVVFLIYPSIRTAIDSFFADDAFVGFGNYVALAQDPSVRGTLVNNLVWILFVPTFSVGFGLAIAVLADRLRPRWEKVSKSVIFLPMAISFVGASTIWKFVYEVRPPGRPQIGLLNGIITAIGFDPVSWLTTTAFNLNDIMLTVIVIWLQAGFAMVLLSAAIKGVPEETIEAARIDGATEVQIFWRVTIPQIRTTIAVVTTTIVILVLKVFDVVYVMTNGNFETEVIANRFIKEAFTFRQFGRAAAIVMVLMVVVIPVMISNIRRFRAEEAR